MASAKELREHYGRCWLEVLCEVVEVTDGGRRRHVKHYPDVEHDQSLSSVLPQARAAVVGVTNEVERRIRIFRDRRVVRSGPLWQNLERDFLAACAVVRGVCATYCLAVENMLEDEDELPSEIPGTDSGRLLYMQRIFLDSARDLLEYRTRMFLDKATSTFVGRGRPSLLAGAAGAEQ